MANINSLVELDFFLKKFPKTVNKKSNQNTCQICQDNRDDHIMRVRYPFCNCQGPNNEWNPLYLVNQCDVTEKIMLFGLNLHNPIELTEEIQEEKVHGIGAKYQNLIEILIHRNILKPFTIYNELLLHHNQNGTIPKLSQIQNYIKYRRIKNGDINSIVCLDEFIQKKELHQIDLKSFLDDEPFYFGIEIKDGSENQHFH